MVPGKMFIEEQPPQKKHDLNSKPSGTHFLFFSREKFGFENFLRK
jgi:hypothetical protein